MKYTLHLIKRFFGSLTARNPPARDQVWVESMLTPPEFRLWLRQSRADRSHSLRVARRAESALGNKATDQVIVAALLHDVGKTTCGLGTFGRVAATLVSLCLRRRKVVKWKGQPGWQGRIGKYIAHPEIGAQLLEGTQSDSLVITWAGEHYLPLKKTTLPREWAIALKNADS